MMLKDKEVQTIAFAKIGKSIKFVSSFSPDGGDNEPGQLLRLLANNNPDKTFVIVGRSDFKKIDSSTRTKLFPYDNVIDVFGSGKTVIEPGIVEKRLKALGLKVDFAIFMVGQLGQVCIPNKIKQIRNPDLMTSVINMSLNYSTPILEWVNDCRVPFIEIVNDPRYTLSQSRDLIPNPFKSLSQIDSTYVKNTVRSYEDQERVPHTIKMDYAEVEKIFLYDRGSPNQNRNRSIDMMIVLNEGNPSRYEFLKEWILNGVNDVEIYGSWEHEQTKTDPRFVGTVQIDELQKKLTNVKFSFIIPIAPGWATSKYIELIHAGVIPFFHPSYASAVPEILNKIPSILRPKTPADLHRTIQTFKETPGAYEKTIDALQKSFCGETLYNGQHLNRVIMGSFISDFTQKDLRAFEKVKFIDLEGFFE